jgi:two-component system alkaline phosphatase synthesis response regulator PhoP
MSTDAVLGQRILLVEDEPSLVLTLTDRLSAEGYQVVAAGDGDAAFEAASAHRLDLIVLDIMLPGMDGFEVCRRLRQAGHELPILMLTARAELVDKVVGLKLGADDYLTKPFEMAELMARIEALLRRSGRHLATGPATALLGTARIDLAGATITRDGVELPLSGLELKLLRYLLEHRGEVLTRSRLLDEVWGYDTLPQSRTVDVHIASLRSKLERDPSHPEHIITVHGLGYKLVG